MIMVYGINGDNGFNAQVDSTHIMKKPNITPEDLAKIGKALAPSNSSSMNGITLQSELTEENIAARNNLDEKVSSTDISYKEANRIIDEIREKYNDDKYYVLDDANVSDGFAMRFQTKKFNPSKLPEPAQTQYRDAVAAKNEIENNNQALVKKAGPAVNHQTDNDFKNPLSSFDPFLASNPIAKALNKFAKNAVVTEAQKAARNKLDEKNSSSGIKYKDAKNTLAEITEKYKDNPDCRSKFESEQPKNIAIYILPHEDFDPYKLPEPDKTKYFEALDAAIEIEKQNSALVQKAGTGETQRPKHSMSENAGNTILPNPTPEEVKENRPIYYKDDGNILY